MTMEELIKNISKTASLFNGRYEYREMLEVISFIEKWEDNVFEKASLLKTLVENFGCVSQYEIEIRQSLLVSIDEFLSKFQSNVQSSEIADAPINGTPEGNSEIQNDPIANGIESIIEPTETVGNKLPTISEKLVPNIENPDKVPDSDDLEFTPTDV